MIKPDITDLTRKMARLDKDAYDRFFKIYYRRLWAYLVVVANGEMTLIEEALQLCLEKVVKNIREFKSEQKFWAWISVVARNAYYDCQRKERSFHRIREAMQQLLHPSPHTNEAEAELGTERLDKILSLLSDNELCLVREKYFKGSSYRQIAVQMGVSEKAVESKLARVRSKLRRYLLQESADE